MILFDSHAHYYDEKYSDGMLRADAIASARNGGVGYVINCGTNPHTSRLSLELAKNNDGFFAAVGVHPEDIEYIDDMERTLFEIEELSKHEKAVAIGEIGLDYHYRDDNREEQKYWLRRQLELAARLELPVIIHDREAHGDCLNAVFEFPELRGVFHSFSGSKETAAELVKRGWYISFSGVITFKNAVKCADIVPSVPSDRILIETDCPYLTPHPFRGKLNHSGYMVYTAQKMADLRGVSVEDIALQTLRNTARLFPKTNIAKDLL